MRTTSVKLLQASLDLLYAVLALPLVEGTSGSPQSAQGIYAQTHTQALKHTPTYIRTGTTPKHTWSHSVQKCLLHMQLPFTWVVTTLSVRSCCLLFLAPQNQRYNVSGICGTGVFNCICLSLSACGCVWLCVFVHWTHCGSVQIELDTDHHILSLLPGAHHADCSLPACLLSTGAPPPLTAATAAQGTCTYPLLPPWVSS